MTMKTSTNGLARKSLSEQIDRLDAMLDGLAEGLNEAVAMVVKEAVGVAVKEAVQVVLREALANPDLLARLLPAAPAAAPAPVAPKRPKVSWRQRWAALRLAVSVCFNAFRAGCTRRLSKVRRWAGGVWLRARLLGVSLRPLLAALGVGAAAGAAAYFLGPWLAAACGAAGGFCATLAVQMLAALKRLLTRPVGSMM